MHITATVQQRHGEMWQSPHYTLSFHACHLKVSNSHYLLAAATEIKISKLWVPLNITEGGPNLFNHKDNICLRNEKPKKKAQTEPVA